MKYSPQESIFLGRLVIYQPYIKVANGFYFIDFIVKLCVVFSAFLNIFFRFAKEDISQRYDLRGRYGFPPCYLFVKFCTIYVMKFYIQSINGDYSYG